MVDGSIDEFEDESGVDTKEGATYESTDDYYYLTPAGWTAHYPPAHSSTYVKATDESVGQAYLATDPALPLTGSASPNEWHTTHNGILYSNFQVDLGSEEAIERIYYENHHTSGSVGTNSVKDITLWATNNPTAFGITTWNVDTNWVQITGLSQSYFDLHVALDQADPKYITFSNAVAYRYWRIKVASTYGDNHINLRHIEFQTSDDALGYTLQSNADTAEAEPDSARIVVFEEDVDSITLNTDLKAYISKDNGATWALVTLTDEGNYETDKRILVGVADLTASGIGSGTSIKWKITTHNEKVLKIHGVGNLWD